MYERIPKPQLVPEELSSNGVEMDVSEHLNIVEFLF